jgi:phosphatidylserine synthase 2
MKLGDSKLGKPITKDFHTYDDNCELEVKNIVDNLDHYFLVHCVNWFVVSWLVRDAWILNVWQIWDEVIELSWQHLLPHFRECWWDHIFLDVLIGNTLFIFLGIQLPKYFQDYGSRRN